ncbi:FHA domain-containing serine/threonine-protein kinase [Rhodopirellula sp. MGV]|uniref:FHA domain-containing serine/threonine-protein kinase n=1 Tax=Rhodopirellula sp. MGV TaxID=2023130 RepID=UPI000B95ED9B|nr:FHA domain-containing serine/threonine-protein kinase [Rhodopirellula sp. MGV]OYP34182.1 hypothetical protein CGZ80_16145 [Rhodopirellula sp. MGV]PNY33617.1 hypothetical protein C2E31_27875 [Rhodopirellula baltica]
MNPHWKLVVSEGPDQGREFLLADSQPLLVGRGSDSDTKIRDPKVSRIHCEIRVDDSTPVVIDRGGAGGTLVDGEPIDQPRRLRPGSVLRIGESILRIENGTQQDQPTVRFTTTPDTIPNDEPVPIGGVTELVGQTLHHYVLKDLITIGRNSAMFRGYDSKRDRDVAVKVLLPQMTATDDQRERFIRAMKTVLPIEHDHIVKLYNAGKKGRYCWAALQWVEGTSAAKLIERIGIGGTLDWREAFRCGLHIARALVAASQHGIVHRNITPANILRRDEDNVYMLSDLVFAKALESTDASQLTKPGDIIGELGYLAPERVMDATSLDRRSDFYGLGATMFALLTGNPPYAATSIGDWIRSINHDKPVAPVASQIGMDERLSDLVMRLIDRQPENRFETASEVLDDFKRVGTFAGLDISRL